MSKKFYIYVTIFLSMLACVFFIGHSFEFAVKHPELLRYYQFSDNYVLSKNREQNRFKIGIIDGPINLKHPELEDVLIEQSFFVNDYTENDIEHATSVAGVISAKNNSIGIKGILEDVFIINAVVLSNSRVEQVDLANAINTFNLLTDIFSPFKAYCLYILQLFYKKIKKIVDIINLIVYN